MKVGQGFDVHRLAKGRRLVLAGVEIAHDRGLAGHSDADVLAHAVGDALLGALGAGELGTLYPSSDPRWEGASGADLLGPILTRVEQAGLAIGNVDTTVVAQEPRLARASQELAHRDPRNEPAHGRGVACVGPALAPRDRNRPRDRRGLCLVQAQDAPRA